MKATIKIQGKQVTVSEGDILFVNRFVNSKAGDTVEIKEVLMAGEGDGVKFGSPYIDGRERFRKNPRKQARQKGCNHQEKAQKGLPAQAGSPSGAFGG